MSIMHAADVGMPSMQLISVHHHQLLIAQCEKPERCHRTLVLLQVGPPVLSDPSLGEGPGAVPATTRRYSSMAVEQRKPRYTAI
jgi:hypothetical protein